MADLGTLVPASPLDASDDNRLVFTNDTPNEDLTSALGDTPADFSSMDTLSFQVEYRQQGRSDDTLGLRIAITNGGTTLATASSGTGYQVVNSNITNTADETTAVTPFGYVNTTADKATWDGAIVELRQTYTQNKGKDGCHVEVDYVAITGTYTAGSSTTPQSVAGSITPAGALVRVVNKSTTGSSTLAGAIIKQVNTALSGSTTLSGALGTVKSVFLTVAGSLTASGAVAINYVTTLTGSVTPTGALSKLVNITKQGSATMVGTVSKIIDKSFTGSLTPSGVLGTVKSVFLTVAGSLSPAGALATQASVNQANSGSVTPSGLTTKQANKITTGSVLPAADLTKLVNKNTGGSMPMSGVVGKLTQKVVQGDLTPTGTVTASVIILTTVLGAMALSGIVNTVFVPAGTVVVWVAKRIKGVGSVIKSVFVTSSEEHR